MSNFPRQVRVIASDNEWNHGFAIGSIITAEGPHDSRSGAIGAKGVSADHGHVINQVLTEKDYEELDAQSEEQKEPRVKYLYSVQDTDGYTLVNTRDREYAREVKSFMGGKKEGVIIMAYAPVKEIR